MLSVFSDFFPHLYYSSFLYFLVKSRGLLLPVSFQNSNLFIVTTSLPPPQFKILQCLLDFYLHNHIYHSLSRYPGCFITGLWPPLSSFLHLFLDASLDFAEQLLVSWTLQFPCLPLLECSSLTSFDYYFQNSSYITLLGRYSLSCLIQTCLAACSVRIWLSVFYLLPPISLWYHSVSQSVWLYTELLHLLGVVCAGLVNATEEVIHLVPVLKELFTPGALDLTSLVTPPSHAHQLAKSISLYLSV